MNPQEPMDDYFRIKEQAKLRAHELRREAIDDFWRGADAVWESALDTGRRSARRLGHSLARHAQQRAQQTPVVKEH